MTVPLLEVEALTKEFPLPGGLFARRRGHRAVDGVSFAIAPGETFGLIGECGSGKSTIGRMIARLITPTSGTVRLAGQDWLALRGQSLRRARPLVQMVFQSSYASLDPRWAVADIVAEPLRARRLDHGRQVVAELLASVGLDPALGARFPHQLSGGQRQRVAIARAIAPRPDLLIADEPVSALDVSVQAQVLSLLRDIGRRRGLAMLFISHDLAVVRHLCERIGVMAQGRLVETAGRDALYRSPQHPYTRMLIDAIPGSRRG